MGVFFFFCFVCVCFFLGGGGGSPQVNPILKFVLSWINEIRLC